MLGHLSASCALQEVLMNADNHIIISSSPQALTHDVQTYLCPMPNMRVPAYMTRQKQFCTQLKLTSIDHITFHGLLL